MINNVTFNGVDLWEELGVVLVSPPNYPIPSEIKEMVHVKGANGDLTEATGYFKDITLDLKFRGLLNQKIKDFTTFKRRVFSLCNNIIDDRLQFNDNKERYYRVKSLGVGAVTKISEYEVDFNIKFICDPFLYDPLERPITSITTPIIYNGDIPNRPIITFNSLDTAKATIDINGELLTFQATPGMISINNNPYSIVTIDDIPIKSEGIAPLFRLLENNVKIEGIRFNSLKIIKNERYLG